MNSKQLFLSSFREIGYAGFQDILLEEQVQETIEIVPLEGLEVENKYLNNSNFQGFNFKNCKFLGCAFRGAEFIECNFEDCEFLNCSFHKYLFESCRFEKCIFNAATIEMVVFQVAEFYDCKFSNCGAIDKIEFHFTIFRNVLFENSFLSNIYFTENGSILKGKWTLKLKGSVLNYCVFVFFNLKDAIFDGCSINVCTFSNSRVGRETFRLNNSCFQNRYNSIDLQSISISDRIQLKTLATIFGIHSPDIKDLASRIVSKIQLSTVFISYSTKDRVFAKRLEAALRKEGVTTYLWEKDAKMEGGRKLKQIMDTHINNFEKLLFIASEYSLKSDACHFELSRGRTKQEKDWSDILIPIHIDNFLFLVEEYQIPREKRGEFWKNILELRERNSLDFSAFNSSKLNKMKFSLAIFELTRALKK
jgi:uncharacterized protein YjbI with pentapeptide repeats